MENETIRKHFVKVHSEFASINLALTSVFLKVTSELAMESLRNAVPSEYRRKMQMPTTCLQLEHLSEAFHTPTVPVPCSICTTFVSL